MNRCQLFVFLAAAVLPAWAADEPTTLVRSVERSCAEMTAFDLAMNDPQSSYFKGWTVADWVDARNWAVTCQDWGSRWARPARLGMIDARVKGMQIEADRQRSIAEGKQRRKAEAEAGAAARAQQEAKQPDTRTAGTISPASEARDCNYAAADRFYAERRVVDARETIAELRELMTQQRRIAAVSGVRNLTVDYEAGRRIVAQQDELKEAFAEYRRLGGKAKTAAGVKRPSGTPCE